LAFFDQVHLEKSKAVLACAGGQRRQENQPDYTKQYGMCPAWLRTIKERDERQPTRDIEKSLP